MVDHVVVVVFVVFCCVLFAVPASVERARVLSSLIDVPSFRNVYGRQS